jgi:hypothetical protein
MFSAPTIADPFSSASAGIVNAPTASQSTPRAWRSTGT